MSALTAETRGREEKPRNKCASGISFGSKTDFFFSFFALGRQCGLPCLTCPCIQWVAAFINLKCQFQGFGHRGETVTGLKSWEWCHNRRLDGSQHKPKQLRMAVLRSASREVSVAKKHTPGGSPGLDDPFGWQVTHVPQFFCSHRGDNFTLSFFPYLGQRISVSRQRPRQTSGYTNQQNNPAWVNITVLLCELCNTVSLELNRFSRISFWFSLKALHRVSVLTEGRKRQTFFKCQSFAINQRIPLKNNKQVFCVFWRDCAKDRKALKGVNKVQSKDK